MSHATGRVLLITTFAFLAGVAMAPAEGGPTAAFEGRWIGVGVEPAPGSDKQPSPAEREDASRVRLLFSAGAFEDTWALGCQAPRYTVLLMPPEGLFQGLLSGRDAADDADRMGFPEGDVPTLRVDCPNGSFDFHLAGPTTLRFALSGLIYTFERPIVPPPSPG